MYVRERGKEKLGIFTPALLEMEANDSWYREPESFIGYLRRFSLPKKRTSEAISVDTISSLNSELRDASTMVLRLGSHLNDRGTQFALVAAENNDLSEYFLIDTDIFGDIEPVLFIPTTSYQALFSFTLLPNFTETSLVNLAISSGLLGHALGLSETENQTAPATGASVFTFDVKPRKNSTKSWCHRSGQVQIDAIFTGFRDGNPILVILESKVGKAFSSLVKHKLLYPYLALEDMLPPYMNVILVYMRVIRREDGYHFFIAECNLRDSSSALNALQVKTKVHYVLHLGLLKR